MGEADDRQAEERIDTAEKRLAALQDLGIDTAALRSRLAFARTCLLEGNVTDVNALCEEVLSAARRLADGGAAAGEGKPRTGRFSRDQLGEEVRALLDQGLFAKLLAEHQAGPDPRLEARLLALEHRVSSQLADALAALAQSQASAQADLATLRAELKHGLDIIGTMRQSAGVPPADGAASGALLERFATQLTEHQERLIATIAGAVERLAQPLAASPVGAGTASAYAPEHAVPALADGRAPAQVLERFAAEAAVQQERLLSALANSMAQFSEVVARHPAIATPAGAPAAAGPWTAAVATALEEGFARISAGLSAQAAVTGGASAAGQPSPGADGQLAAALERIAGQAAEQQERVLTALAGGMQQLGALVQQAGAGAPAGAGQEMAETVRWGCERISAAIASAPAAGAPGSGGSEELAPLFERFAAHSAEQQERLLSGLAGSIDRLGAALGAHAVEAGAPAGELAVALRAGFQHLGEALQQRPAAPAAAAASAPALGSIAAAEPAPGAAAAQQLTAADLADLVAEPAGPPGTVSEHDTTRFFQSVSTRTEKPAVRGSAAEAPARPAAVIDTGRVRQLVAAEVGQQITDRQGSSEPVTIYDPEQVRVQVVAEVNRLLAERPAPANAPTSAPAIRESELGKLLVLMLPGVLVEEPVRRALFSLICLEAVANPGALGELSGLRSFLRRELALAAEDLAHDAQPA